MLCGSPPISLRKMKMNNEQDKYIELAIKLLKRGKRLPLDLVARLIEEGVLVYELEQMYGDY